MAEDLDAGQQTAAMHGLATNVALPVEDRLACALQALEWYEAKVARLKAYHQAMVAASGDRIATEHAEILAALEGAMRPNASNDWWWTPTPPEYLARDIILAIDLPAIIAQVQAAERAKVRAKLLAIGEDEYNPMGRMRSLLRDLADRVAPEDNNDERT